MSAQHSDRSYITLSENLETLSSGLPILTYHKIARRPRRVKTKSIYLGRSDFSAQIDDLARAGYTTASLDDALPATGNPGRKVVITFDDGYTNVLQNAAPVLKRHGFTAIQFLVADRLGQNNRWDVELGEVLEPLMTVEQIKEWLALGHEIGAHTLTHPHLPRLSDDQAREEISASKKKLEDTFGLPIRHFCYPYGECDARLIALVQEAGYATACTTRWGANTTATDRFALKRLNTRYRSRNLRNTLGAIVRLFRR